LEKALLKQLIKTEASLKISQILICLDECKTILPQDYEEFKIINELEIVELTGKLYHVMRSLDHSSLCSDGGIFTVGLKSYISPPTGNNWKSFVDKLKCFEDKLSTFMSILEALRGSAPNNDWPPMKDYPFDSDDLFVQTKAEYDVCLASVRMVASITLKLMITKLQLRNKKMERVSPYNWVAIIGIIIVLIMMMIPENSFFLKLLLKYLE
jgi:hypothetical protein